MTEEERIAKAKDLGLPKFRVKQLANHYYGHFDVNAEEFSDFPATKRVEAAKVFFPTLITEVTRQVADEVPLSKRCGACSTVLLLSPCSCAIPHAHVVHLQSGRLRHGMPLLRYGPIGSDEKHVGRRDSGTGSCGRESHA